MKKIGPLSLDLVIACQIYEMEERGNRVEFGKLVKELDGLVSKSAIPPILVTLANWGIINTEYGETEAGRAGRRYYISGEAREMIKQTYERFWKRVNEFRTRG